MLAKAIMTFGTVGVGGYCVVTALNYDAAIYPYSLEATAEILEKAKSVAPRADGDGVITISSEARKGNIVQLVISNYSTRPMRCNAVLEELKPTETKVALDCSGGEEKKDAMLADLELESKTIWFKEHINAVGEGRDYDRARVFAAQTGLMLKSIGSIQSEAAKAMAKASVASSELSKMSSGSNSKIDWDKPVERDTSYSSSSSSLSRTERAIEAAEAAQEEEGSAAQ